MGALVGWGGVGIGAAGGAVGFPVVVPVVVGAAAGVGVVAAAKALKKPVGRATSTVHHRVGGGAPEETEEGTSGATETTSKAENSVEDVESRSSRAEAAAAVGLAAAVAGASLIPKLRRRIFRNAEAAQTKTPPHARKYLYEKQQGICNGCSNQYLFKDMTLDHIVPRARGGTNELDNLQLLCHHCNALKGVRSWNRFLRDQRRSAQDTKTRVPPDDPPRTETDKHSMSRNRVRLLMKGHRGSERRGELLQERATRTRRHPGHTHWRLRQWVLRLRRSRRRSGPHEGQDRR